MADRRCPDHPHSAFIRCGPCRSVALASGDVGALSEWAAREQTAACDDRFPPRFRAAIADSLGRVDPIELREYVERAADRLEIQEATLAGVWRVRSYDADETAPRETVLISAFPRVALTRAFPAAPPAGPGAASPAIVPDGLMNGLSILTELLDHSAGWTRGDAVHAVNFSLLPHTPEDLAFVEARLGVGATTILSRGYGNCRVTATATPNVWWVRYYNSVDTLILNTVEVTHVPAVVCAAAEDIADSAERLAEILDAIGGGAPS